MNTKKRNVEDFPKYDNWLENHLKDKEEASLYLQASFDDYQRDGDLGCLLLAIRSIIKSLSNMTEISRKTGLNRESLYTALSKEGNPQFSTIFLILGALEFHFAIRPLDKAA